MKKIFLILLMVGSAFSVKAEEVFLKQNVEVTGEYITLGDIFAGVDKESAVKKIALAPAPSKTLHFDAQALSGFARKYNVNWKEVSGFEKTSVLRSYQTINSEEIVEAIKSSDKFKDFISENSTIESRTLKEINIAQDVDYEIEVVGGNYNSNNSNFRAEVNIIASNKVLENFRIVGKILTMVEVPVLKKSLSSGMVISEQDINYIKISSDEVKQKAITDVSELIGKECKRTLKPDVVLTTNDVRTQILVGKSKMVKVIYKKKNMTLSYSGKALEDGSMGEYIRFQPANGTGSLQGVVIDSNTILVSANASEFKGI